MYTEKLASRDQQLINRIRLSIADGQKTEETLFHSAVQQRSSSSFFHNNIPDLPLPYLTCLSISPSPVYTVRLKHSPLHCNLLPSLWCIATRNTTTVQQKSDDIGEPYSFFVSGCCCSLSRPPSLTISSHLQPGTSLLGVRTKQPPTSSCSFPRQPHHLLRCNSFC